MALRGGMTRARSRKGKKSEFERKTRISKNMQSGIGEHEGIPAPARARGRQAFQTCRSVPLFLGVLLSAFFDSCRLPKNDRRRVAGLPPILLAPTCCPLGCASSSRSPPPWSSRRRCRRSLCGSARPKSAVSCAYCCSTLSTHPAIRSLNLYWRPPDCVHRN